MGAGAKSANQQKGHYRRWGAIGGIGRAWDISGAGEYAANQPQPKNERYCWGSGPEWGITECDALEYQNCITYGTQERGQRDTPHYLRLKSELGGRKVGGNMGALKFESWPGT